jgi:hypothetical protein
MLMLMVRRVDADGDADTGLIIWIFSRSRYIWPCLYLNAYSNLVETALLQYHIARLKGRGNITVD